MGIVYDFFNRSLNSSTASVSFRAEARSARRWAAKHLRHGNTAAAANSTTLADWADQQANKAEREGR